MHRYARTLLFGSALMLAIGLLANSQAVGADDDEKAIKQAQKEIVELADAIKAGRADTGMAGKMRKKYEELNTIMQAYKPRLKKGIGVGPKGPGDGIEAKLISLGKRAPTGSVLEKQKDDLIQMGYINLAIAEVTAHYTPEKPKGGKGPKEWKLYSAEMKKASKELITAIKAGDPAKVKTAANNLNNACNNCHTDFRDS